jgi:hypothetical protein
MDSRDSTPVEGGADKCARVQREDTPSDTQTPIDRRNLEQQHHFVCRVWGRVVLVCEREPLM